MVAVVSYTGGGEKVQDKLRGVPQNVRDDDSFPNFSFFFGNFLILF